MERSGRCPALPDAASQSVKTVLEGGDVGKVHLTKFRPKAGTEEKMKLQTTGNRGTQS